MRLRIAYMIALLAGGFTIQLSGQSASAAAPAQATPKSSAPNAAHPRASIETGEPIAANSLHAERKAAKLYLKGVKLLEKQQPEAAWNLLKQATALQPGNTTYATAAELARQSTVTLLVQQSSRARAGVNDQAKDGEAAQFLQRAVAIDPTNPLVLEHLNQNAQQVSASGVGIAVSTVPAGEQQSPSAALDTLSDGPIELAPNPLKRSFHLRNNARQVIEEVFRTYGIEASVHDSVQSHPVRLDLDDVTFAEAVHALGLVTQTFYEPLDPHRVIVAKDTRENRNLFERLEMETIYLPGLNEKELTEVSAVAKNVFDAQQAQGEPTAGTLTLRASPKSLDALNATVAGLEDGKGQIDLDVKVIQLAHVTARNTGTTFFQQTGVYNVLSEINSVLSQNQSLVQQIIASGLVPNSSTLANQIEILAILVASGQLTGTPFNQGFLPFGGGITQSILSPGPATLNLSLNSSDTRVLDDIHMQLTDEEDGTFKIGERYPIETSSFSSAALPAIAGITSAALSAATESVPQVEYQDIGLTLKATPKVMRSNDVAITLDLKITALGGSSLNDIPILNNQQVSGVLTLKAGETAILVSDLSKTESRALSGLPGVSDIPGLEDVSDIQKNENVARLLILVTPAVVRTIQPSGHGPMLMVDKGTGARTGTF